jgi:tetratricopeptide (TPR) repeat protein
MASLPLPVARQMVADRLAEGDAGGALALARQILDRFPRDGQTLLLAGRAKLARGDVEGARSELERAAQAFPDSREICGELAARGSEQAASLQAELPPLPSANGDRPAISSVALGHLYLRQLLLTHCTAQLEPLWRADSTRLDVGLALAEAHWRLGETSAAEDACRTLLWAAPDCLKANLILAQQLWSADRRDEAGALISAAEAVDPENGVAEELYEWLVVRDPSLVPLRRREVSLDLAESAAEPVAPEQTPPVEEEPVHEELTGIEDLLSGIPALLEPIPEPKPFWERWRSLDLPSPEVEPLPPAIEDRADVQTASPLAASAGEAPPEPPTESFAARAPEAERVDASPEPEPWAASSTPEPVAVEAHPEPPAAPPGPEPVVAEAHPEPEPGAGEVRTEPDLSQASPEPALTLAERAPAPVLRWVEVSARGQVLDLQPPAGEALVAAWIDFCGQMGERLTLGALRASSIESPHAAVQLLHEQGAAIVALASSGANLGLVRSSLRRSKQSSEEPNPS